MVTQEQLKLVTKELEDKTFQRNLLYNVENELNSLNEILDDANTVSLFSNNNFVYSYMDCQHILIIKFPFFFSVEI